MADINLSKAVRSNLSSLQNTASLMAKTSDRLSTGNKVNSALDNPTNFFTASSLNSRAGDLNQLMDSMANGIKTIEAADNGLKAITKTLESMQSTLRQARQDKSFQAKSFSLGEVDTSAVQNLTFSGGSVTGDVNVALNTTAVNATDTTLTGASGNFTSLAGGNVTINGTTVAIRGDSAGTSTSLTGVSGATLGAGTAGTITIAIEGVDNGDAFDVALASGDTLANVATKINAAYNTAAGTTGQVLADATSGQLVLTSATQGNITLDDAAGNTNNTLATIGFATANRQSTGGAAAFDATALTVAEDLDGAITGLTADGSSGQVALTLDTGADLTVGGADALLTAIGFASANRTSTNGTLATEAAVKTIDELVSSINENNDLEGKVRASNDNGKLRIENLSTTKLDIEGLTDNKLSGGAGTSSVDENTVRADLAKQYNELRDQLDKLADDASFNGINLLRGDNLKITFNENGTSSIDILAKDGNSVNSANLGVETSLDKTDLNSDTGIDGFLDQIKGALGKVRSQASAFGSNLSIVQNRQDFTKSMINTLETGAGNLTLADMNQEAANMMALQTRQSLASSTLSMANQADQSVLQLLR